MYNLVNPELVDKDSFDFKYLNLLSNILANGYKKGDRTGTGTISTFGQSLTVDISGGKIPLLTTKRMFHKSFTVETLWFVSGSTDIKYLKDNNVSIWDSWVIPESKVEVDGKLVSGSIGIGAYGAQWRNWEDTRIVESSVSNEYMQKQNYKYITAVPNTSKCVITRNIDQLAIAIEMLRNTPDSRRIIVSAWNPGKIFEAALPPCHSLFQFQSRVITFDEAKELYSETIWVEDASKTYLQTLKALSLPTRKLSCLMYQRSADYCVGSPFNLAQYALLTHMVAQVTGHVADKLFWAGGDVHVYNNQTELAKEQIKRSPYKNQAVVKLNGDIKEIDDFKLEDISIENYNNYHPAIAYPVAI